MKIDNLTVTYGSLLVLDNLTLSLPDKGVVCLFAPSGSGKTTLLNVLCGLQTADSGTVSGLKDRSVSVVFQEDRLIPQLTIAENLRLPLSPSQYHLVSPYLSELGLDGWEEAYPAQLSGGMRRRIAIARAFAFGGSDALYLLDEPLKGLDTVASAQALKFMKKHLGNSLAIFVTHNHQEAESFAQQIITFSTCPLQVESISHL